MGKTNWMRVFFGGLVAGVILNILNSVALAMYLRNLWNPALESLNPSFQETTPFQAFWIVFQFVSGILAVWLYSAMRPRYGAGPKTAQLQDSLYGFFKDCPLRPFQVLLDCSQARCL